MKKSTVYGVLCLLVALMFAPLASAETVKVEATRDVWISSFAKKAPETDFSMGAVSRIKLKGYEEFGLFDFDIAALKGRKIKGASLYLKPVGASVTGINGGSDLRWISVSTITHPWEEGRQDKEYQVDTVGCGATYNESSYSKHDWGWPGARVVDVILGNGNSLRTEGELRPAETEGWLKMALDPAVVQLMVAGATHGICLMEGTTDGMINSFISSREGGAPLSLVITVEGEDKVAPAMPERVRIQAAPESASRAHGALSVALTVPAEAVAMHVRLDGALVDRWQIPLLPTGGGEMVFPLIDLPPAREMKVEISVVDGAGNVSKPVAVTAMTSAALSVPALPAAVFSPAGGDPRRLEGAVDAVVWALPEVTKVHPVTGAILNENVPADFRRRNAVWDGADGSIRLAAARAEIVSFQIVIEGVVTNCRIHVSELRGAQGALVDREHVRLWRNWYVAGQAEYALPMKDGLDCPASDNAVRNQKLQAVTVDYHIPKTTVAGDYQGRVTVSAGGRDVVLPLKVKVYDVVIPDDLNFNPELNAYKMPSREFYQLAHYHRCTVNSLPYGQGGKVQDAVPTVGPDGRLSDWQAYDARYGELLDGSCFRKNPRAGVPVATLYLPLCEGWPLDFRKYFQPGCDITGIDGDPARLVFNLKAKPIGDSFPPEYRDRFIASVRDFHAHAREKGWNRTAIQCYLNNKPKWGYSAWTLDEPRQFIDWVAINFWAGLFKTGIGDPALYTAAWQRTLFEKGLSGLQREEPIFLFRGDISRPQWQGSLSDGLMNALYANNGQFAFPRLMRAHQTRLPAILYSYGACNMVDRSNWESAAWCLQAYIHNCDGVLPWQSIGREKSMTQPDQEGLLLFSPSHKAVIASLRVHALRRGAQDCELLRLLQLKKGWSREQIAMVVAQKMRLDSEFKQEKEDDASAASFSGLSSAAFLELKEGVLQLLAEGAR